MLVNERLKQKQNEKLNLYQHMKIHLEEQKVGLVNGEERVVDWNWIVNWEQGKGSLSL